MEEKWPGRVLNMAGQKGKAAMNKTRRVVRVEEVPSRRNAETSGMNERV
jgi:hypothetical protein